MKKILFYALAAVFGVLSIAGCSPSEPEGQGNFDKTLLSGEWTYKSGSENIHLTFKSDGTGYQTTDDQPEPQNFTWTLSGSRLAFVHNIEMGGAAPEDCTVTTLTATRLVYKTPGGTVVTCTKL
jgi:hypothetical protein